MERYDELKKGESGTLVSIAAYPVLSAMKLIIGYVFHSEAHTAEV
ncbi:putative transporter YeaB [Bacillus amyloliquefaciens]|nr:putative transporter YeaB [Bacillus amyloliquefaciens]